MTSSCSTIVDRKYHVQYQRAIPDDCIFPLTEQNIAINDHNDAMGIIGQQDVTFKDSD